MPPSGSNDASSVQSSPPPTTKVFADEGSKPVVSLNAANDDSDVEMAASVTQQAAHNYEYSDLDEITMRQLGEDILAYNYDLDYCRAQLGEPDLTPQETRTLQLRILDLGHQIRHCKHRIETIKAQTQKSAFPRRYGGTALSIFNTTNGINGGRTQARIANGEAGAEFPGKRSVAGKRVVPEHGEDEDGVKRLKTALSPDFDMATGVDDGVNTALQRLGFWKCRLCSAPKYLLAGSGRSPAAPCKWPLKDISKMITHFTEMHAEHTPAERCAELGAALSHNRGPFEYWLRKTRAQNISDDSVIDDCLGSLISGKMPGLLRRHSRAAAGMPVSREK
ncbi:hypothetical protein MMYC01_205140 [Madurella mycetomatis]|uniref:Uncharacterized protein n=1 Tax=Madurella mycetomatis TaxID=100816 RepID=A0A175W5U3_9PEZI|nr:hypothetical protein MMYC01_205140 [Madurella mycetomatis]